MAWWFLQGECSPGRRWPSVVAKPCQSKHQRVVQLDGNSYLGRRDWRMTTMMRTRAASPPYLGAALRRTEQAAHGFHNSGKKQKRKLNKARRESDYTAGTCLSSGRENRALYDRGKSRSHSTVEPLRLSLNIQLARTSLISKGRTANTRCRWRSRSD